MAKSGLIGVRMDKGRTFFSGEDVISAIDRKQVRGLFQFGGFVRQTSRRSMRKAGKNPRKPSFTSAPGKPPRVHTGILKDAIRFAVVKPERAVFIGPQRYPRGKVAGTPRDLEEGGTYTARLRVQDEQGNWHDAADAPRISRPVWAWSGPGTPSVSVRIEPRPYMLPAFEIGARNLGRFFGDR